MWGRPPRPLALGPDEVHVWQAALDLETARLESLERLLPRDERAEADRFRAPRDRRRFVAARARRRSILARYLEADPSALAFTRDPGGKPRLVSGSAPLCFNVSHADGLALYAVAWEREVGVDVERVREDFPWVEVAARYFAPAERAVLSGDGPGSGPAGFARIWAAKEAYLKATGRGLDAPLDGFSVAPAGGARIRLADDRRGLDRPWCVIGLDAGPEYAAALAAEGDGWRVRLWDWDDAL